LEQKQDKTQEEMEALVDVTITYKLTGDGKDAWKDVPILLAADKQRYTTPVNSSVANNQNEILELKKQIQLLMQEKTSFQIQAKQFQQEATKLELQVKEKDKKLRSLRDDKQSLQRGNSTIQDQIKIHTSQNNSLQSENQELKLKINSLEYQLKEKDNKINLLENENRIHRTSSVQQIQKLDTLNHEKNTLEQNKMQASFEMEQLKASNSTLLQNKQDMSIEMERLKATVTNLEKLLKSKEDATTSLNSDNKHLSTANQFIIEMVETQKSLLQSKTNEMELLRQTMERQLADEKKRNEVLEQENRVLKQERVQDQTHTQSTSLFNNNRINPTNVESVYGSDDDDAQNDINYDSELDNTEESEDDEDDDINYDTPSEDEKT
jgi:chromosome segregation ATPase